MGSVYDSGLPTGPLMSFVSTIKKLIRGRNRARRGGWKNGWTLPKLRGPRSLDSVRSGMAAATTATVEPAF